MTTLSLLDPPPPGDEHPSAEALLPAPAGWPASPERAVYHELLGAIVNTIAPHTEADPVAILTQLLVAFGAAVGRGAWFTVEATRHHPNEFMLLVGDSSRAGRAPRGITSAGSWRAWIHRSTRGSSPACPAAKG